MLSLIRGFVRSRSVNFRDLTIRDYTLQINLLIGFSFNKNLIIKLKRNKRQINFNLEYKGPREQRAMSVFIFNERIFNVTFDRTLLRLSFYRWLCRTNPNKNFLNFTVVLLEIEVYVRCTFCAKSQETVENYVGSSEE